MEFSYYKSIGSTGKNVAKEMGEAAEKALTARSELLAKYSANGLYMSGFYSDTPSALGFKEEQKDKKYLKYIKFENGFHKYIPKKNTKIGKEIAKDLSNPDLQFSFCKFILDKFNLQRFISDSENNVYFSQAGIVNETILVSIPGSPDDLSEEEIENGVDIFPRIPLMFRKISKEEFLDIQNSSSK